MQNINNNHHHKNLLEIFSNVQSRQFYQVIGYKKLPQHQLGIPQQRKQKGPGETAYQNLPLSREKICLKSLKVGKTCFFAMIAKLLIKNMTTEVLLLQLTLHLYVILLVIQYVIKMMADIENISNDDEFLAGTVDTPKEVAEQRMK